jgi:hypothetical protein
MSFSASLLLTRPACADARRPAALLLRLSLLR